MSSSSPKFDSFLKRVLDNHEYKEVKAYEPCVVLVLSAKKHAFRFTFLTNERIYVTENPPKSLLFHLDLKDIVAVKLVRDKALFLQSDLQEHVQHIVLKHYKKGLTTSKQPGYENDTFLPSSHYHSTTSLGPSAPGEVASTSSLNSVPMLCSYADIQTIDRVSELKISDIGLGDNKISFMPNSGHSGQNNKKIKVTSKKVLSGSWQHSDPCLVRVAFSDQKKEIEDLHLYILNEHATFHMMLKSVWRNYIVYRSFTASILTHSSSNLLLATQDNIDKKASTQNQTSYDQSTRVLFSELRQELLITDSVEHIYRLYHELKEASSNDILLKLLFWKDQALFDWTINLLIRYTKNSAPTLVVRCDEIELLTILLRCLGIMLREVEAIPQCYRVLQNLSQSRLCNIIDVLLQKPAFASSRWILDDDLSAILLERVTAASEVFYQLIMTSEQVHWIINGVSDVFNSTVLLGKIDENCNLEDFLNQLLKSCVSIWSKPTRRQTINNQSFNSEEAIDVFHMFTVLHRIISRSTTATQYARSSFQEEFRYYVNPNSVSNRFPLAYPISGMARDVVHATGAIITKK